MPSSSPKYYPAPKTGRSIRGKYTITSMIVTCRGVSPAIWDDRRPRCRRLGEWGCWTCGSVGCCRRRGGPWAWFRWVTVAHIRRWRWQHRLGSDRTWQNTAYSWGLWGFPQTSATERSLPLISTLWTCHTPDSQSLQYKTSQHTRCGLDTTVTMGRTALRNF